MLKLLCYDRRMHCPVILAFGPFRYVPSERALLRSGTRVTLPARASDILQLLIERAGELVTKDELIAHAWPDDVVGEGALRVHISGLRKILERMPARIRYLENVAGQGYRFVAPVTLVSENTAPADRADIDEPRSITHVPAPEIVGRAQDLSRLGAQLSKKRLVTVVGPGGVGKTAVASVAADRWRAASSSRGFFVDLSTTESPAAVSARIASALGLSTGAYDVLPSIENFLKGQQTLLLLDTCEHVVDSVTSIVETLLQALPNLHILATSREPLRAVGESVLRLSPLEVPHESGTLTVVDALRFSAVSLFCVRAKQRTPAFELKHDDISAVVGICRKLDGLPLAIELAATLIGVCGVREIAANLERDFQSLTKGPRNAPPRHQTLRASLEWSYQLLSPVEQKVLCRLAVFAGSLDLASATAVVADADIDPAGVLDSLMDLVAKSVVMASVSGDEVLVYLLNTSRSHALEKLDRSATPPAPSRKLHNC
jgi:predicted ATPase